MFEESRPSFLSPALPPSELFCFNMQALKQKLQHLLSLLKTVVKDKKEEKELWAYCNYYGSHMIHRMYGCSSNCSNVQKLQ